MKLYIAGPMSGRPDFNYPAFEAAAKALREAGYDVASPHEVDPDGQPGDHDWKWYMRRTIAQLLTADGVATLEDWTKSKGAALEVHIAGALDMPARPLDRWLWLRNRERAS